MNLRRDEIQSQTESESRGYRNPGIRSCDVPSRARAQDVLWSLFGYESQHFSQPLLRAGIQGQIHGPDSHVWQRKIKFFSPLIGRWRAHRATPADAPAQLDLLDPQTPSGVFRHSRRTLTSLVRITLQTFPLDSQARQISAPIVTDRIVTLASIPRAPTEMDSVESWQRECNWTPKGSSSCKKLVVVARDRATREILGGAVWEYFVKAQSYLFCFLYVAEEGRGKGLGLQLALRVWKAAVSWKRITF